MTAPVHVAVPLAEFRAAQAKAMTEAELTASLVALAEALGWTFRYHTHDSRRSPAGFPDEVLVHPRQRRLVFAELKRQKGRVSPAQREWLDALELAGAEAYLWRPADLLDGTIGRILRERPLIEPSAAGGPQTRPATTTGAPRATASPRPVPARLEPDA